MKMWAITAEITDWSGPNPSFARYYSIPMFYLNENIQGITDEDHAKKIAGQILNPERNPFKKLSITAVYVESVCDKKHERLAPERYLFEVKFKKFAAEYWAARENDTFRALRYSPAGDSLWIWKDGHEIHVPIVLLLKRCSGSCGEWMSIPDALWHFCR